jgi:hypothetical protein
MKKVIALAALGVLAVVLAPVASANAATLAGACTIKGAAKFGSPLAPIVPSPNSYSFSGSAECVGSGSGVKESGTATVSGSGELACPAALSALPAGKGELTLPSGTYKFELRFVAQAGVVDLVITPEGEPGGAVGAAEFLTDGVGTLEACANGKIQEKLEFTAAAAGVI